MSMANEGLALRAAIEALDENKKRRRYDEELRRRVVRYARAEMRGGATATSVAQALDIGLPTLLRFLDEVPELIAVTVIDEPDAIEVVERSAVATAPAALTEASPTSSASPRTLTVRGPHGLEVEGLTLDDVVGLFQRMAACSR